MFDVQADEQPSFEDGPSALPPRRNPDRILWVAPYKGWSLYARIDGPNRQRRTQFFARMFDKVDRDVPIHVAPYVFEPSNARFQWLVDNGFPTPDQPLTSYDIDEAIERDMCTAENAMRDGVIQFATALMVLIAGAMLTAFAVAAHG